MRGVSALTQARVTEKSEWTGKVPEAGQAGTGFIFIVGHKLIWQSPSSHINASTLPISKCKPGRLS